ncbi:hypothetical protein ARMSODRAFT_1022240 [Armillaria solidipes]|uniref:Ribonuclease H1 N-terminal domain-containing protein n=1 Tax=Armillaria solidipes TaxID=1076256 RepID=A0A2H3B3J2_9AGAR|nr:hypothetical protein ARMSODRAFT_1022240 [Armillaria solidipes]
MANTTTPSNPSVSVAGAYLPSSYSLLSSEITDSFTDFALLMAALNNLNLTGGVTLTTTQLSNSLIILAPRGSAGSPPAPPPAPPGSSFTTASTATPSTTSTITISTPAAGSARTMFKPIGASSAHRTTCVWPPHTDYYVITSGQEVGLFFDWDDTTERVLGVPYSKYKHKNSYYHAITIYEKAYDKSQIHVTPIAGSQFDISIQDEWGSLDWDSDDEASFKTMTSEV